MVRQFNALAIAAPGKPNDFVHGSLAFLISKGEITSFIYRIMISTKMKSNTGGSQAPMAELLQHLLKEPSAPA